MTTESLIRRRYADAYYNYSFTYGMIMINLSLDNVFDMDDDTEVIYN